MYIDLSGEWKIMVKAEDGEQSGVIQLPGILQAAGYGNPITWDTPWVSALHDDFWYEQEEYKYGQEEQVNVPFLAQPPRHFLGVAVYERIFTVPEAACESGAKWQFHVELARWRSRVYIDGAEAGTDESLCAPHDIPLGRLAPGEHTIRVELDNSMIYPYRPDGHGVSDALGATWNGMVGEMALFTEDEAQRRAQERKRYAMDHMRTVEARDGRFVIDGTPVYFRATHFGGENPLTGYPATDKAWWGRIMKTVREWGLNGLRFHSYCPPEAAFAAADEADVYLLVECGMWNHFEDTEDGAEMMEVLRAETRKILENFGHHPSFVFFSPTNEPGGRWHAPLRRWVSETREYDRSLGYGGRRIYTAESGWHYDVHPAQVEGTDFLYFHRSGYGPFVGGTIRNPKGWNGRNYSPSLEGVKKPVVCHELGQYCTYPNYDVIDKFTGFMQPGNYKVFYENAKANGILPYEDKFVKCSGENQLRMYKEDLEANFRTPEIQGFELLDLHDYLGQGTALVGILDAFWENKGYGDPARFREHCGDTVLLAGFPGYVWKNTDRAVIPIEVCHYGKADIENAVIAWRLGDDSGRETTGELQVGHIARGGNTRVGEVSLDFGTWDHNSKLTFTLTLRDRDLTVSNHWTLYVFVRSKEPFGGLKECSGKEDAFDRTGRACTGSKEAFCKTKVDYDKSGDISADKGQPFVYTRDWKQAKQALEAGERVIFNPWLSDLNYECPALSGRTVGWNSQMGPTWCRTMGIVVEEEHPIFRYFPTDASGGWQWEDILRQGRGFHMEGLEQVRPIVQPIDDWNRNLLQGLIFEAKVSKGRLLMVTANLEGDFEKRPAAYSLKQAIFRYVSSEEFAPETEADAAAIERKLFPMLRMGELTKEVLYEDGAQVKDGDSIVEADPSSSLRLMQQDFPAVVTVILKKSVSVKGILYVPEQRDRNHAGFARDYQLEVRGEDGKWLSVGKGTFLNTCRSQQVLLSEEVRADAIRLTVLSAYGCVDRQVWRETGKGWYKVHMPKWAILQIAGLHVLCEEEASHRDDYASMDEQKSKTKEIEL